MRTAFVRGLAAIPVVLATFACQTPQWPVDGAVTSPFGMWGTGVARGLHRGVDIAVPVGTPVRPILSGRVRFTGVMRGYGNVIWVDHGEDLLSVYAHLSEISVRPAQEITKATVLGLSGRSGNATGPNLHFEVWRWGREVDPVQFLGRPRK